MSEVIVAPAAIEELELPPEEAEKKSNKKVQAITAGALGALGLLAFFAENRGWVSGWPPPSHSLKHPWIGYYSAYLASKIKLRSRGQFGISLVNNSLAETAQDFNNHPAHPLHWANVKDGTHNGNDIDNALDAALCLGGTVLFIAQANNLVDRTRSRISLWRKGLFAKENPGPALAPAD